MFFPSLSEGDQVSHPYQATVKIIVLFILLRVFKGGNGKMWEFLHA
jgi:hypothetical protein